jgi:hypothetical protein
VGVLLWIVRVIVLLLVIRLVLNLLFGSRKVVRRRRTHATRSPERVGGELVRDPNCGTHILKERAIAVGTGADIKYFCSTTCRDAYQEKLRSSNFEVRS